MTNEQKARAYDEALKDMRVIYPNLSGDAKLAVEHAFPQLAESEDERIRKAIIELLKEVGRDDTGISENAKCMIAYLEKQKDLDKMIVVSPEVWDKAISDAFENGKKDGEKQKDFELTEEDKKIIPEALIMLCDDIINHRVHTPIKTDEEGARKIKAFLKTFNRQPHKTKAEWEKRKKQKPISFNEPYNPDDYEVVIKGNATGLKKEEQKPEWSEEDEKMLNMIEHRLKDWDNIKTQQGYQDDYTLPSPINWLKSLRPQPHWKPSEEQIMALRYVLNHIPYDSHKEEISGLLEQIVKL